MTFLFEKNLVYFSCKQFIKLFISRVSLVYCEVKNKIPNKRLIFYFFCDILKIQNKTKKFFSGFFVDLSPFWRVSIWEKKKLAKVFTCKKIELVLFQYMSWFCPSIRGIAKKIVEKNKKPNRRSKLGRLVTFVSVQIRH